MPENVLKALLRGKDRLFFLIYEFNCFPTRYIHSDWIKELLPGVNERLLAELSVNPRSERRLARFILARCDIDEDRFHGFEEPSQRLALLDPDTLRKLLFYAGIAIASKSISHLVEGAKVIAVKQVLGEDGYLFALKKAPFLLGKPDFPDLKIDGAGDLPSLLFENAMQYLKSCFGEAPLALTRRMLLKLPIEFMRHWEAEDDRIEANRALSQLLFKKILIQEVNPSWAPYFR
jgi:hypothetical protein